MSGDQLSGMFDLVEVRGVVSGGFVVRGPWVSRADVEGLKFFAMVRGRARLRTDGVDGPVELGPGDVALLNHRSWLLAEGGEGEGPPRELAPAEGFSAARGDDGGPGADVVVGGHIDVAPAGRALLLDGLPPVAHVGGSGTTAAGLRGTLHRLFEEATGGRPGSAFAVRQYGQLLLLEVMRVYLGQDGVPPGWLRLLADDRLRPAVGLMHEQPGRSWGLAELARAAAMSRTSFAERFRDVAGMPPLTYLHRRRMLLARRALGDDDVRVGSLASELGYSSESAFSAAFKREVGVSPLGYRRGVRAGTFA